MFAFLPKHGDGFILRELTNADANLLAEIEFNGDVKAFLALPKREKSKWIDEFDSKSYNGCAIDVDGVIAGRASILRCKRRGDGELAIVVGKPFWGLRLGRKVAALLIQTMFEELNARAVVAIVHPENQASIALLRAFKFKRRGIVIAESENWQNGHFIYRLPRSVYESNSSGLPHKTPKNDSLGER